MIVRNEDTLDYSPHCEAISNHFPAGVLDQRSREMLGMADAPRLESRPAASLLGLRTAQSGGYDAGSVHRRGYLRLTGSIRLHRTRARVLQTWSATAPTAWPA